MKRSLTIISNISEVYRSRCGYRIYTGYLDDGRYVIDVCLGDKLYKKLGSRGDVLFSPPQDCIGCDLVGYLSDLDNFTNLDRGILKYSKIARRWFMKRASNMVFGSNRLSYYLKPGTNELDWKKVYKEEEYDNF